MCTTLIFSEQITVVAICLILESADHARQVLDVRRNWFGKKEKFIFLYRKKEETDLAIAIGICFAIVIVAMIACVWNAGDCSREEEREDEELG